MHKWSHIIHKNRDLQEKYYQQYSLLKTKIDFNKEPDKHLSSKTKYNDCILSSLFPPINKTICPQFLTLLPKQTTLGGE